MSGEEGVIHLGRGDHHEHKHNDKEISAWLAVLSGVSLGNSFCSGVPLNEEYCPFKIRLFPSQLKEDDFTSNNPLTFALAVAGIFVFTSVVFVLYDFVVEVRQQRVVSKANASTNLVSSLSPKTVRDQLYQESKAKEMRKEESRKMPLAHEVLLRSRQTKNSHRVLQTRKKDSPDGRVLYLL